MQSVCCTHFQHEVLQGYAQSTTFPFPDLLKYQSPKVSLMVWPSTVILFYIVSLSAWQWMRQESRNAPFSLELIMGASALLNA